MKLEFFLARGFLRNNKGVSKSVVKIAVAAVALSVAVMICSVAVIIGFENEITEKVAGFGACINIVNRETGDNFETFPVDASQDFLDDISDIQGVKHIQKYALKPALIKSGSDFLGVMLKGIDSDYDWSFFNSSMIEGENFTVTDSSARNSKVVISKNIADALHLKSGDSFGAFFIQQPPKMRKYTVCGIYNTGLEEYDKVTVVCDIADIRKVNDWTENQITGFEILIDDFDDLDIVTQRVRDVAGYVIADDGSMLNVKNVKDNNQQLFDWLTLTEMNVWVILAIMFFVAFVNMSSATLIIIFKKASAIGDLKAQGARNSLVRRVFVIQSLYMSLKGIIYGNLVSFVLIFIQWKFQIISLDPSSYYVDHVPVSFNFLNFAIVDISTLIILALMLWIPALAVSRMQPAKVLQFG